MMLSPRFKLFASVTAILTAGIIGCQIQRGAQQPHQIAPEAPRHLEPLPEVPQPLLPPPSALVPPAEDELPVPSAGLSPIQRMCFTSCSSCPSPCEVSCCDPCCRPSFGSRIRGSFAGASSKMNALHCRTKQIMSSLNPFGGGCSSCTMCDPCCSPCMSSCDSCCSDGFVVSDVAMPCSTGCGTWAPTGCGMQAGVWAPTSQPMMPQGYYPQQYPQMPAQAPCNCQQQQGAMMHPGYAALPQMGYGQMPYANYPQMNPQGYAQQPQQQVPQYQYPAQPQMQMQQPVAPAPAATTLAPGHTQPNYSQPMAVGPQSGLQ